MATDKVQITTSRTDPHTTVDTFVGSEEQVDEAITIHFRRFPTEKYGTDIIDMSEENGIVTIKVQRHNAR